MIRSCILLLCALLSFFAGNAQNVAWQWAKYCPNIGDGRGRSIATDAAGNVYVTGTFHDGMRADTTNIYGPGNTDVYIAKFNSEGDVSWIKWLGGKGEDAGNCIAVDKSNNVYVCGSFSDTAYFDQTYIVSKGSSDIFLIKMSSAGDITWVKTEGTALPDAGNKLTIDPSGNVFMTGFFGASNAIPPLHAAMQYSNVLLTSRGNADAFIANYKADGSLLWVKGIGGGSSNTGNSIACDADGSVYMTSSMTDFYFYIDTLIVNNSAFSFASNSIVFVKFDSTGALWWYKIINGQSRGSSGGYGGSTSNGEIFSELTTTDNSGNVYLTGAFQNCNILLSSGNVITGSDNEDIYIAKYSSAGYLQWSKKGNPTTTSLFNNQINGLCSRDNRIYLTGTHNGQILMAEYDENGAAGVFDTFGTGPYTKGAADICAGPDNHFYMTGSITTNTYLDNIYVGNLGNNSNMFLGKLHIFPMEVRTSGTENALASLYPVPSAGKVNMAFESGVFSNVTICNITGQVVRSLAINKGETLKTIDLTILPDGIYFAELKGDGKQELKKIIIAR